MRVFGTLTLGEVSSPREQPKLSHALDAADPGYDREAAGVMAVLILGDVEEDLGGSVWFQDIGDGCLKT